MKFIDKIKAEYFFLILGGLFGILFLFITPVFQVPDEPMHLLRACEVASGVIHNNKEGDITKDILPNRKIALKQNYSMFKEFNNKKHYTDLFEFKDLNYTHNNSGYSFLLYIPSAIGIKITSLFSHNPYTIFYAARLFNLFSWLALIYFAIKLTPFKWQYMICALFPMTVYEGMSISADSINIGFAFLYTAFIFHFAYVKKASLSVKDIILLAAMTILSVFFKGLFILSLLLFLIPNEKFRLKYLIISFLLALGGMLQVFVSANSYILIANDVDITARKLMIINQPLYVLRLFANTFLHKSSFYLQSSIFRLGWRDIEPNPIPVVLLFYAYLAGSCLDKIKVKNSDKLLVLTINGGFILLTVLLYYLTFSPLNNNIIIGAQGRYFIPLFLSFAVVCQNSLNIQSNKLKISILAIILFNLIYAACII